MHTAGWIRIVAVNAKTAVAAVEYSCSDINRGWDIFTEHYSVRTNHSLEEGVRLAAKLVTLRRRELNRC